MWGNMYICKQKWKHALKKHIKPKEKRITINKQCTSPRALMLANGWHHPSAERPPLQLCGVARQPKWDRDWGRRRKEKKIRQGSWGGGVTYQASVHSSGSACVGLEGHRWPYPRRACCDREEAEEKVHFDSSHQGPWACFEWAAAGTQHKDKNTHQLVRKTSEPEPVKSKRKQVESHISVHNIRISYSHDVSKSFEDDTNVRRHCIFTMHACILCFEVNLTTHRNLNNSNLSSSIFTSNVFMKYHFYNYKHLNKVNYNAENFSEKHLTLETFI